MPKTILVRGPSPSSPEGPTDEDLVARAKAGDFVAKNDLIRRFSTTIKFKSNAFSRAPMPSAAIEGEGMSLLLQAVEKFNPGMGLKFKTFLEQMLKGLYRYVATNKNIARIPEHQVMQISRYKTIKEILRASKDREPTTDEVADSIGWPISQVVKMETSLSRRSVAMSDIEGLHEVADMPARMKDVAELEYFGMMPEEKLVYDYSMGAHGKKTLTSVAAISKAAGLPPDKVYAIKRALAHKIASRI